MDRTEIYETKPYRRTWAVVTAPLVWLFIFAGVILAGKMTGLAGLYVSSASGRWQDNITALFASLPVLGLLWLWLKLFERRSLADIGLAKPQWGLFGRGFFSGMILVSVVVAAGFALGGYELVGPGAWYDHLTPTWLFAASLAIIGTIVQALTTEAMYRGWMLSSAASQWGVPLAILFNVVASFLIQGGLSIRSIESLIGAINMALMACVLCNRAMKDGTLWGVIGLHAAWNLTMGLGLGLNVDGGHLNVTPLIAGMVYFDGAPPWLTGGEFGPDGSILMTVVAGLVALWGLRGNKGAGVKSTRRHVEDNDEIYDH